MSPMVLTNIFLGTVESLTPLIGCFLSRCLESSMSSLRHAFMPIFAQQPTNLLATTSRVRAIEYLKIWLLAQDALQKIAFESKISLGAQLVVLMLPCRAYQHFWADRKARFEMPWRLGFGGAVSLSSPDVF